MPMKIDYKINKQNPINKYSYKKGIEQKEKNMQENNNKKVEIISNKQNEIKEKNENINKLKKYQSLKKPQIKKIENEEEKK